MDPVTWRDPDWPARAAGEVARALADAGRSTNGPATVVPSSGRSHVVVQPTERGPVWVKFGYDLPPTEERVLDTLRRRRPERLPALVATWPGAVAMEPLAGVELSETHPLETWCEVARHLAELLASEAAHVDEWRALGVRDRTPATWRRDVEALLESEVVRAGDDVERFERFLPDFVARFEDAFASAPTLVPQDCGCCNVHVTDDGPIFFDWADVVVGHATFACDRLLDQVPPERKERVIEAFLGPLGLPRPEFDAMRRSNVLHEVLRYHDELAYLDPEHESYEVLSSAVRNQLHVLVEHEAKKLGEG